MKKIYIWGTGAGAADILDTDIKLENISGFIDTYKTGKYNGIRIYSPENIKNLNFDAIIVAVQDSQSVYKQILDIGLPMDKIIFLYRSFAIKNMNKNIQLIHEIFGNKYTHARTHVIDAPEIERERTSILYDSDIHSGMYESDFVRIRTLEMLKEEINNRNINGAVAELGVYKGEFSKYINCAFPHSKMYLFDTFEGFSDELFQYKDKNVNWSRVKQNSFTDTSEQLVMSKLLYPANVEIKKGYFPDSLNGLEDKFSFVSIDVDLYEPIYQGLKYFYPRLLGGGYIMLHDYNTWTLKCVKKAVDDYEKDFGKICRFPCCDSQGSLIITRIINL